MGLIAGVAIIGLGATSYAHSDYQKSHGGHEMSERGEKGGHHRDHGRKYKFAMRMMEKYDLNKDEALTLDEVMNARAAQFKSFDKDNDGYLELSEYEALWADVMRERMVDRFQSHDNDGDGKISVDDYSKKVAHMVRRMDRNEDGKVDYSDMK